MKMVKIETIIETFVGLQSQLVFELKRTLGARDWRYLTDIPRRGELHVGGMQWQYEVHGTGVRFYSDRGLIDMNRHLDADPRSFDAGRLVEYLSSVGQNSVVWAGNPVYFDYEHGPSILRQMHANGAIQRIEGCDGELYTLSS
jgi:hypothetical protein